MYISPFIVGFIVGVVTTVVIEAIVIYSACKKMSEDENK